MSPLFRGVALVMALVKITRIMDPSRGDEGQSLEKHSKRHSPEIVGKVSPSLNYEPNTTTSKPP